MWRTSARPSSEEMGRVLRYRHADTLGPGRLGEGPQEPGGRAAACSGAMGCGASGVLARGQVPLGTEGVCWCDGFERGLQGSGSSSEGLQYGIRAVGGRCGRVIARAQVPCTDLCWWQRACVAGCFAGAFKPCCRGALWCVIQGARGVAGSHGGRAGGGGAGSSPNHMCPV